MAQLSQPEPNRIHTSRPQPGTTQLSRAYLTQVKPIQVHSNTVLLIPDLSQQFFFFPREKKTSLENFQFSVREVLKLPEKKIDSARETKYCARDKNE